MENAEIARVFEGIGDLLELRQANTFRVRSYREAARTLRDHPRRIDELAHQGHDLTELPHIGAGMADKIDEILESGTCRRREQLAAELPRELTELMAIPGRGPRKVMQLHRELGVTTVDDLERAARDGRVRELRQMGRRTEQRILAGIDRVRETRGRVPLREAGGVVERLGRHLDRCDDVAEWEVAGSFRRRKETVGDLDILIQARDRAAATDQVLELDDIAAVESRGEERVTLRLRSGLQVDLRYFDRAAFGAALHYFTGSRAHNVATRRRARERGWKLNEYGLSKGKRRLAGRTEQAVYGRLGLDWIPPELREDRGELAAAAAGELPRLVQPGDIRGDLQCHTTASDGRHSIRDMAEAARALGHQYLAITDHSRRVTMAGGLDDDEALRHAEAIREVDRQLDDLWLLAGIEVDVLRSGALDLKRRTLEQLDWVLAAMHYDLGLGRDRMTRRLVAAIESGVVHAIAHPLNRMIGQREPVELDLDAVLEACADNGVRLEINAHPERLDLPDTHCQQVLAAGVGFCMGTDAHRRTDLELMRFGVDVARRGWVQPRDLLNTRTARQLARAIGGG